MTKQSIFNSILRIEGGFSNDPSDSGGATKLGITEKTARSAGYKGYMRNLSVEEAENIYDKLYWKECSLDEIYAISEKIAEKLFDISVNMGPQRAAEFLQRSLNVLNNCEKYYPDIVIDKKIGKKTIKALSEYMAVRFLEGESVLVKMLTALQGEFYVSLCERRKKDERFIFGWFLKRIA